MCGLNRLLKHLKDFEKHAYQELENKIGKEKFEKLVKEAKVRRLVTDYQGTKKLKITEKGLKWLDMNAWYKKLFSLIKNVLSLGKS